jgi:hypothetical protein
MDPFWVSIGQKFHSWTRFSLLQAAPRRTNSALHPPHGHLALRVGTALPCKTEENQKEKSTNRPQSDHKPHHKPSTNHPETMAEPAPNSPSPRPKQIDKCASGGGRRADGCAFVGLGRPGGGCVQLRPWLLYGSWLVSGRGAVGFWSGFCLFRANSNHAHPRP